MATTFPSAACRFYKVCGHFRIRRRGASVVEFAIVAPVFILLVLGMIEYGRMIMVQQVITNASREGARQAALDGSTTTSVNSTVNTYLSNGSISGASVAIVDQNDATLNPATATAGTAIKVKVTVNFDSVKWLPVPMFLAGKQMQSVTTMRKEASN